MSQPRSLNTTPPKRCVNSIYTESPPLLRPGATCWRCERADRVAVLIDSAAYFAAVCSSLQKAQRSIMLLGWQFDPRTALVRGDDRLEDESQIGRVLRSLASQRTDLDVRVLIWDMALPISMSRALFPQRARSWFQDGVRFALDDHHALGACRHQKIVVIDDRVAFCSGSDFAINRWDSAAHRDWDPHRRLPSGRMHRPRHGATMVVDGSAAAALGELCRAQWRFATGDVAARPVAFEDSDPWPDQIAPDARDLEIGVVRTEPRENVRENEALYLESIAAAHKLIYLENQYFASPAVADALASRLREPEGPEIVVVCSKRSPVLFDRMTMDAPRTALLNQLHAADRFGRFAAYAPVTAHGQEIIVHSKVTVIDDRLLRIGSTNINNRSMGLDSECDLALDATLAPRDEQLRVRHVIARLWRRLLAHHLGAPTHVLDAPGAMAGCVQETIDAFTSQGSRRLERLTTDKLGPVETLVARYHLGDPETAHDSWRPWRRRKSAVSRGVSG